MFYANTDFPEAGNAPGNSIVPEAGKAPEIALSPKRGTPPEIPALPEVKPALGERKKRDNKSVQHTEALSLFYVFIYVRR